MAFYHLDKESIGNEGIETRVLPPITQSLDAAYKNRLFHWYMMMSNTNINELKHSKYVFE